MAVIIDTYEVIHNWYNIGFSESEPLEMFPLEDLYDTEPIYNFFVKDGFNP